MVLAIIAACVALLMFVLSLMGIIVGRQPFSGYDDRVSYFRCLTASAE